MDLSPERTPPPLHPGTAHRGNPRLLALPLTALFCSQRCPGDVILRAFDLAKALREAGAPVIGGFQTPVEKECLRLLLRGRQPVVVCPARGIGAMRIPREWRAALEAGRLLVLSPFPDTQRRPTAATAARRNDLVADLARRALFIHAATGSRTEAFARALAPTGTPLLALESPANANLLALGARLIAPAAVGEFGDGLRPAAEDAQRPC